MKLYSTNNRAHIVDLKEAVLRSLPQDNGLYMPCKIPKLSIDFIQILRHLDFSEIAYAICSSLFDKYIDEKILRDIIDYSIDFPAPLVKLDDSLHVLELFHGPSLAFKDFGARFMAQLMAYLTKDESRELTILVATSGDTGGAVAAGFHNTPGVRVIILYPKGMVSPLQEKQLTTLGGNITALEIDGSFDDCQAMVKKAFLDKDLKEKFMLSSANSINIARLIPQSFYYFEAYRQLQSQGHTKNIVFSIPSGNFGNLTAGILAKRMGLPIHYFLAANNVNDAVNRFLSSGNYQPRKTIATISNAMDVGNPSNFARMIDLFFNKNPEQIWQDMKKEMLGYSFTDDQTRNEILRIYKRFNYIIDPHSAVGSLAFSDYQQMHKGGIGVVLATAHPSKFLPIMEKTLPVSVQIPEKLAILVNKEKHAIPLSSSFPVFKDWMMN